MVLETPAVQTSLDPTELFPPIDEGPSWGTLLPVTDPSTIFRHSGWQTIRQRVYDSLGRTGQHHTRLHAFRRCGCDAYVMRTVAEPHQYRVTGSGCHDRFCTPCARERSQKIALTVIDQMRDSKLRFATLTVLSTPDPLAQRITHLLKSFATLRRTALWDQHVTGGVAFLECTYSTKRRQWHPHLHCLIEGSYMPQRLLSQAWYKTTGDSSIVDIRFVKSASHAAHYVTKYAVKPLSGIPTNEPDLLDEAVHALRRRRLCTTYGTWRGLLLTQTEPTDAWILVESLNDLIARAKQGQQDAVSILNRLAPRIADRLIDASTQSRDPPRADARQPDQMTMPAPTRFNALSWAAGP